MGIDLYWMPGSPPSRAVAMAGKALGIDLNLKMTNIMTGENMTPEFLKMNPQHTVPTMDDNGFYLTESRAILQYLANKYAKDDSLYPKDPKRRALVDQSLLFDMGTLYQRFGDIYYPMFFGGAKLDVEKQKKLDEALAWCEGYVGNGYAAGDQLTIADFSMIASLTSVEAVGHDISKFPGVIRYMEKCKKEIKGFKEINQPGIDEFAEIAKSVMKGA